MAATVKIEFKVGGDDAVLRSFKTILQASQASGREQVKVAQATARAVAKATNDNGSARGAAAHYAKEIREAKTAADKKIAEAKRAADGAAREAKRGLDKMAADHSREIKQRETKEAAAANRSAARTIREIEARERAEKRAETRSAAVRKMEERKGQRIAHATEFARIDDINHRRGAVRGALGDSIKRGVGSAAGVIGAGAAIVGGYLGTNTVLDAGRAQLDLGKREALLQNAAGKAGNGTVALSKSISNVVGEDAGSIMGGLEKIAAKAGGGGLDEAKEHMLDLSKLAKGAGVSMEDLGDVTATLLNRGIKGTDLAENIRMLIQQGKDGAVEFKDMATMLDASSGALLNFKMGASQRTMVAGGLTQIGRTFGKSSAAEATNSVVDIGRDLGGKAKLIKKLSGVDVHVPGSKGSQMRNIEDLIPEILEGMSKKGTSGDLMGAGGIFTGNSTAIMNPLAQAMHQGIVKRGKGPDARWDIAGEGETAEMKGADAVKALMAQSTHATMDAAKAMEAFVNVMKTQSEQTSVAMNKLKNDLGNKLAPVIAKAAPDIVKMIAAFGEITAWALSNPFKAVGALMLASIGKSLVGAGASSLLDKFLSKAIPSLAVTAGTVNVVGGAGAGGAASLLAPGGAGVAAGLNATTAAGVLAAGAGGYMAGSALTGAMDKSLVAENAGRQNRGIAGIALANDLRSDPSKRVEAQAALAALKGDRDKGAISRFGEGVMGGAKGLMSGDISAGNVLSLAPQVALARGLGNAVLGGKQASEDKTNGMAIADLESAIKATEVIAALERVAAATDRTTAAVSAAALQAPKLQAP